MPKCFQMPLQIRWMGKSFPACMHDNTGPHWQAPWLTNCQTGKSCQQCSVATDMPVAAVHLSRMQGWRHAAEQPFFFSFDFMSVCRQAIFQPLAFCMQLTLREKSSAKGKGKQVATFLQITLQSSQFVL